MPLDPTISPGQSGHISDHQNIHDQLNAFAMVAAPTGVAATDTAAIQTAIDTAPVGSVARLRLQPGVYVVTALTADDKTGVSILGAGRGATIVRQVATTNGNLAIFTNCAEVTISDLTFDQQASAHTGADRGQHHTLRIRGCTNVLVHNVAFVNAIADCLSVLQDPDTSVPCESVTVDDCWFDGWGRQGVFLADGNQVRVANSSFVRSDTYGSSGVSFEPNQEGESFADWSTIGCSFVDCNATMEGVSGGCHLLTIHGNRFDGEIANAEQGRIEVKGYWGQTSITGNTIRGDTQGRGIVLRGISAAASRGGVISGNTVTLTTDCGEGIVAAAVSPDTLDLVLITGNVIDGCGQPVGTSTPGYLALYRVGTAVVADNLIQGITDGADHGFYARFVTGLYITDNVVIDTGMTDEYAVEDTTPVVNAANSWNPLTSTVYVDAESFVDCGGSPSRSGNGLSIGGRVAMWLLDGAGGDELITASVFLPTEWATWKATVYWINVGADTGDVELIPYYKTLTDGTTTDSGTAGSAVVDTANAQWLMNTTELVSGVARGTGITNFVIRRVSSNAADTIDNDIGIAGVLFEKVT